MAGATRSEERRQGVAQGVVAGLGQVLVSVAVPIVAFIVLWAGFLFLRDSDAPKLVIVAVAIVWGVGGTALLYVISNWLVEKLPTSVEEPDPPVRVRRAGLRDPVVLPADPGRHHVHQQLQGCNQHELGGPGQLRLRIHQPRHADRHPEQRAVAGPRDRVLDRVGPGHRGARRAFPDRPAGQDPGVPADGDLVRRRRHHLAIRRIPTSRRVRSRSGCSTPSWACSALPPSHG